MSRRVLMPRAGSIDRAASRMAPGGRVSSESRIEPHYPMVGDAGEEPPPPVIPDTPPESMGSGSMFKANGGDIFWTDERLPGDILTLTAIAAGTSLLPPIGWTQIAGGTLSGDPLYSATWTWFKAWGVSVGGPAGGNFGPYEGFVQGISSSPYALGYGYFFRFSGTQRPTLINSVRNIGPGATSGEFVAVPGGSYFPTQEMIILPNNSPGSGGGPLPVTYTPPSTVSTTGGYNSNDPRYRFIATIPPTIHPNTPQFINVGNPYVCSMAAFSWLWA